jgi:hypothetical protein
MMTSGAPNRRAVAATKAASGFPSHARQRPHVTQERLATCGPEPGAINETSEQAGRPHGANPSTRTGKPMMLVDGAVNGARRAGVGVGAVPDENRVSCCIPLAFTSEAGGRLGIATGAENHYFRWRFLSPSKLVLLQPPGRPSAGVGCLSSLVRTPLCCFALGKRDGRLRRRSGGGGAGTVIRVAGDGTAANGCCCRPWFPWRHW